MYVRLAFAVAAHLEPEILLVDEVLAVGDMQFQKKCLSKMEAIGRDGRTVLFVSHNMSAVNTLCDKGLLFSGGVLVKGGAASEVSASYMSSGTETTGVRTWKDADAMAGSEGIRLSLVRMRNAAGEVVGSFERSSSFSIEIEYELLRRFQEIRLGVDILTTDGIIVFCSHDSEDTSWRGKMREAGRYTSVCFTPNTSLTVAPTFLE